MICFVFISLTISGYPGLFKSQPSNIEILHNYNIRISSYLRIATQWVCRHLYTTQMTFTYLSLGLGYIHRLVMRICLSIFIWWYFKNQLQPIGSLLLDGFWSSPNCSIMTFSIFVVRPHEIRICLGFDLMARAAHAMNNDHLPSRIWIIGPFYWSIHHELLTWISWITETQQVQHQ